MDANELSHPTTWREILLAQAPFLLFPLILLTSALISPFIKAPVDPVVGLYLSLGVIGVFLILMLAGWVQNFPRWVFPYWGFILVISLYVSEFTGTMAGYQVRGDWWAWIPVAGVAVIGTLWARGYDPVLKMVKAIWKDWTLLSFTFYGALPLLFIASYDEVRNDELALTTIMLILAIGASLYMRTESIWRRLASLGAGFFVGWAILMIHQGIYWNGRQEPWMPEPGSWMKTLNWTSRMGVVILLIIVAPVLVEFLRWWVSIGRRLKAAD
jgi:hypothetical protein